MKKGWRVKLVFVYCSMLLCSARHLGATIIIVGTQLDRIVFAADSRITHSKGAYRDTACKVTVIDDRVLFAVTGNTTFRADSATFVISEEAKLAIQAVRAMPKGAPVESIANKWAELAEQRHRENREILVSDQKYPKRDAVVLAGIFGEVEEKCRSFGKS